MKIHKWNTNNKVDKAKRKSEHLRCPICPPNRGENAKRRPKHGRTKPKSKDHRR